MPHALEQGVQRIGVKLADPHGAVQRTTRSLRYWSERNGIPGEALSRLLWGYVRAGSLAKLCLLREGDGTLISGDHLLPNIPSSTLIEPTRQSSRVRVRSGLKHLVSLSQLMLLRIGAVLPGHGEPFSEAAGGGVMQRIETVRRRAERAYQHLCEKPLTVWQLSQALFPNTEPEMALFAVSNAAGYLDLLAANGRVVELSDTGIVRYVATEALSRRVV